jgi:1-acyl-sn-glycerol-3-phosphate acyltransferase
MTGSGLLLSLWCTLVRPFVSPAYLTGIAKLWGRISIAAIRICCNIHIKTEGLENLPTTGGAIIAAQHQSELDFLTWLALLPHPAFVFKIELRKIPLLGPLLTPAGMIVVDRSGKAAALRKLLADCQSALAEGRQIIIFPEGTRVAPGEQVPLQPGIAGIAKTTHAPIIPASTNSGNVWRREAFTKFPGTVTLKIHPPLPPNLPRDELMTRLHTVFYEHSAISPDETGKV